MDTRARDRVKKNGQDFLLKEKAKQWLALPGLGGGIRDTAGNRRKLKRVMDKKREIENLLAEFRVNPNKTSKTAAEYFRLLSTKRMEMEELWKSIERE